MGRTVTVFEEYATNASAAHAQSAAYLCKTDLQHTVDVTAGWSQGPDELCVSRLSDSETV